MTGKLAMRLEVNSEAVKNSQYLDFEVKRGFATNHARLYTTPSGTQFIVLDGGKRAG
jgi:hypothetical protein